MKNVVKRGKSFYVRTQIDGVDRWKSLGTDQQQAEVVAADIQTRRKRAKLVGQNDEIKTLLAVRQIITFAQAVEHYLTSRCDLKAASLYSYNNYGKHLLPYFGPRPLHTVTEADVEVFKLTLVNKGLGPKYANEVLRYARAVCGVQLQRRVINSNPFAGIKFLRENKGAAKAEVIDPLTPQELASALAALPEYWRSIFTFLAYTGMRPGEAFALRWKHIDWKNSQAKIALSRVRGAEDSPKTDSSRRDVYLIASLVEMLKDMKKNRKVQNLDDHVFVQESDGKPYDKHIDGTWRRALRKASVRHRPSYQLRHSYISIALQNGIEPGWIARQVGHANLKMIFEVYAKWMPGGSKQNEAKLSAMFSESVRPDSSLVV